MVLRLSFTAPRVSLTLFLFAFVVGTRGQALPVAHFPPLSTLWSLEADTAIRNPPAGLVHPLGQAKYNMTDYTVFDTGVPDAYFSYVWNARDPSSVSENDDGSLQALENHRLQSGWPRARGLLNVNYDVLYRKLALTNFAQFSNTATLSIVQPNERLSRDPLTCGFGDSVDWDASKEVQAWSDLCEQCFRNAASPTSGHAYYVLLEANNQDHTSQKWDGRLALAPLRDDASLIQGAEGNEMLARLAHYVADVNDAPVIKAQIVTLNVPNTSTYINFSVSMLLTQYFGYHDPDADMGYCVYPGIVVIGQTTTGAGAQFDYSLLGDDAWTAFGLLSEETGLTLTGDSQLRFKVGSSLGSNELSFAAWDGTCDGTGRNSMVVGSVLNISGRRGGRFASSVTTGVIRIVVVTLTTTAAPTTAPAEPAGSTTGKISPTADVTTVFDFTTRTTGVVATTTAASTTSELSTSLSSSGDATSTASSQNSTSLSSMDGSSLTLPTQSPTLQAPMDQNNGSESSVLLIGVGAGAACLFFTCAVGVLLMRHRRAQGRASERNSVELPRSSSALLMTNETNVTHDGPTKVAIAGPQNVTVYGTVPALALAAGLEYSPFVLDSAAPEPALLTTAKKPSYSKAAVTNNVDDTSEIILQPHMLQWGTELGRGEYGIVFDGLLHGDQRVAIKVMTDLSAEALAALEEEAAVMQHLAPCTFVLGLVGVCHTPYSIVAEFAANGALREWLRERASTGTQVEQNVLLRLCVGTARGVAHLHEHGIVHRDLATRNILLMDDLTPKVADFGLARVLDSDSDNTTKSNTGPLRWMAPEAIKHREYSTKTDVWALGITIVEIYTFAAPLYPGMAAMEAASQVAAGRLTHPIPSGAPQVIKEVISACFAFKPEDRPTVNDIVQSLD